MQFCENMLCFEKIYRAETSSHGMQTSFCTENESETSSEINGQLKQLQETLKVIKTLFLPTIL